MKSLLTLEEKKKVGSSNTTHFKTLSFGRCRKKTSRFMSNWLI